MKKSVQLLFVCLAAAAFTGCFPDKGNYEYTDLSPFYIDTEGTRTNFTVAMFDRLEISPNVVYAGDPANLDYMWKAYITLNTLLSTVISTDRNLSEIITIAPQTYFLEFNATERSSGRRTAVQYELRVEATDAGMMVLYERNGLTDFGLITPTFIFGNAVADKVVLDIYTATNPDYPLAGAPVGIGGNKTTWVDHITICTQNDVVRLSTLDYSITHHFSDLVLEPILPEQRNLKMFFCPQALTVTSIRDVSNGTEQFFNNNILYNRANATSAAQMYFNEMIPNPPVALDLAPYLAIDGLGYGYVFDRVSKRIMQCNTANGGALTNLTQEPGLPLEGFDVVHMARCAGGYGYAVGAIFKGEGADAQKRYYYILEAIMPGPYLLKGDISTYPGIAQAELFAMAMQGPVTYYVSNTKIYQIKFNPIAGTVEEEAVEVWAGNGETITAMEFLRHPGRDLGLPGLGILDKYLFVATYNGTEGKVYVFEVNLATDGSLIQTPVAVYSGFGKVKGFSFKY